MVAGEEIYERIIDAEYRIRQYIRTTPLEHSSFLSGHANVYLKLENVQYTRSFKVRGALNKLLSLDDKARASGLVTASTGNHGLATAFALTKTGGNGTIFVPNNIIPMKLSKLRRYDVKIEFHGNDSGDNELYAKKTAKDMGMTYISPYNDPAIIAGQGTIGIELEEQLKTIDHVYVTVGGGGLISGIAIYLKTIFPNIRIIGCLPENSPVMYESIKAGKIIEMESKKTLSDGSAGGIEPDSITFPLVKQFVDDFILVSEEEIANAMKEVFNHDLQVIEGAAGTAVAAFMKDSDKVEGNAVIIICGGNISSVDFKEILDQ